MLMGLPNISIRQNIPSSGARKAKEKWKQTAGNSMLTICQCLVIRPGGRSFCESEALAPSSRTVFFCILRFQTRAMSRLGNELPLDSRPLSRLSTHNTSSETNVLVAWLERFEDHAQFPVDELLMEFDFSGDMGHSLREKETVIIFIYLLRSGLYRIHIRSTIR